MYRIEVVPAGSFREIVAPWGHARQWRANEPYFEQPDSDEFVLRRGIHVRNLAQDDIVRACRSLVERHEALRTTHALDQDGRVVCRVHDDALLSIQEEGPIVIDPKSSTIVLSIDQDRVDMYVNHQIADALAASTIQRELESLMMRPREALGRPMQLSQWASEEDSNRIRSLSDRAIERFTRHYERISSAISPPPRHPDSNWRWITCSWTRDIPASVLSHAIGGAPLTMAAALAYNSLGMTSAQLMFVANRREISSTLVATVAQPSLLVHSIHEKDQPLRVGGADILDCALYGRYDQELLMRTVRREMFESIPHVNIMPARAGSLRPDSSSGPDLGPSWPAQVQTSLRVILGRGWAQISFYAPYPQWRDDDILRFQKVYSRYCDQLWS